MQAKSFKSLQVNFQLASHVYKFSGDVPWRFAGHVSWWVEKQNIPSVGHIRPYRMRSGIRVLHCLEIPDEIPNWL